MGSVTSPATPALTPPAPLVSAHDLSQFDCSKPALNDWLRRHALRNEGRASRTFVVCDGVRVVGYYVLAAGSVFARESPGAVRRNMPEPIPVLVLGRLAVDNAYKGKAIGSGLLEDALRRALSVSSNIGARAILVHAIDDEAAGFYKKYNFQAFPEGTLTFFLPLEHVAAAIGGRNSP